MKRPGVRVLAGRWKGRELAAGSNTRPTSSRARAALFDILQNRIGGAAVLDLFAGSGAVGIEAVSRGARRAVLVEPEAAALVSAVERLGAAPTELRVLAEGARSGVRRLARDGERFDFVFADPPYGDSLDPELLAALPDLLNPDGVFVLQRDDEAADTRVPGLRLAQKRPYGRNVFLFFGMR